MSGHSKWSSIKHKKGAADQKRGKVFTKVSNMISVAAKEGGSDSKTNSALELAISKAKTANMPKDKIEHAIKRGTGELEGVTLESATYEGYGPSGIALIIETISDNKNRTVADLRRILSENNGKLADAGSVNYLFEKKGLITINLKNLDQDKTEELELIAIEADALDCKQENENLEVYTSPKELNQIKKQIETAGFKIASADLIMDPKTTVKILDKSKAEQVFNFIEKIEEMDDVSEIHGNFDIAEEILS